MRTFNEIFTELATEWTHHEELRSTGDLAALYRSRARLDHLRYRATVAAGSLELG